MFLPTRYNGRWCTRENNYEKHLHPATPTTFVRYLSLSLNTCFRPVLRARARCGCSSSSIGGSAWPSIQRFTEQFTTFPPICVLVGENHSLRAFFISSSEAGTISDAFVLHRFWSRVSVSGHKQQRRLRAKSLSFSPSPMIRDFESPLAGSSWVFIIHHLRLALSSARICLAVAYPYRVSCSL